MVNIGHPRDWQDEEKTLEGQYCYSQHASVLAGCLCAPFRVDLGQPCFVTSCTFCCLTTTYLEIALRDIDLDPSVYAQGVTTKPDPKTHPRYNANVPKVSFW